jgi:hypothetical protein
MASMAANKDPKSDPIQSTAVVLDDLVQDLFGLSARAVSSIVTLYRRPEIYYAAARDKDWEGRFTPSIRLWLSIFALLTFLQFIWLREDSPLVAATAAQLTQADLALPDGMTVAELSQEVYTTGYAAFPILALLLLTFGGLVFPFWGKGYRAAMRVRYTFATIIPSAIATLLVLIIASRLTADQMAVFPLIGFLIAFCYDSWTAARGAFPESRLAMRIVRALGLAIWLGLFTFLASGLSGLVALVIITLRTGVPLI